MIARYGVQGGPRAPLGADLDFLSIPQPGGAAGAPVGHPERHNAQALRADPAAHNAVAPGGAQTRRATERAHA